MPNRKEIRWSQLRVGVLIFVALAVLVLAILLMSGTTGGPFAHKLTLRSYFTNAAGLKNGAPVTLEGVTIGSVERIRVVPDRNPTPVEIRLKVGEEFVRDLHTDSTTSIAQAGVLGDSYVDIDSTHASGPPPGNNAELQAIQAPSIQSVISSSQEGIIEVTELMRKTQILMDSLNSKKGTIGGLINDPTFYTKISHMTANLEKITGDISEGKGSLGKLITDDTLYNRANAAIDHVNRVTGALDQGQGSLGKLLKDDTLYDNLNSTVQNANQLLAEINSGQGAIGKLAKDPVLAKKLDDTISRLDSILTSVDEGKGTLGQMVQNRALYDHLDQTADQSEQLIKGMRENPKKYLVIRLKLF